MILVAVLLIDVDWGDFFFLVEHKKTFEGVLQSIPHPMYSIGYIGYYGAALICQSYTVFFVGLVSHICDILFLTWVEKPHSDKLYQPPEPGKWYSSST